MSTRHFSAEKDAEEWGIDIERRIDRQEPTTTHKSRDVACCQQHRLKYLSRGLKGIGSIRWMKRARATFSSRRASVIVALTTVGASEAKRLTSSVAIVFVWLSELSPMLDTRPSALRFQRMIVNVRCGSRERKSRLMFCRSERDCLPGAIIDYPLEADGVKFTPTPRKSWRSSRRDTNGPSRA
jgi:hypothetical protein